MCSQKASGCLAPSENEVVLTIAIVSDSRYPSSATNPGLCGAAAPTKAMAKSFHRAECGQLLPLIVSADQSFEMQHDAETCQTL